MAVDEKIIYVYDGFSEDEPWLIGRLYVGVKHIPLNMMLAG